MIFNHPSARSIANAIESKRSARKARKKANVIEIVQRQCYERGNPILIYELLNPIIVCTWLEGDAPTHTTYTTRVEYESWLVTVEFRQTWKARNGKKIKLLFEEYIGVVSKIRTDKYE